MKFGNEFWLILFREYISPKLFAVRQASAPNITYTGRLMSTYLTSYMKQAGAPNITYTGILKSTYLTS